VDLSIPSPVAGLQWRELAAPSAAGYDGHRWDQQVVDCRRCRVQATGEKEGLHRVSGLGRVLLHVASATKEQGVAEDLGIGVHTCKRKQKLMTSATYNID
jgi:hypothetical protein